MGRALRNLCLAAAALTLGAVSTVATSWLLAVFAPTPSLTDLVGVWDGESAWQVNIGRGFGASRRDWSAHFRVPPESPESERRRFLESAPSVLEPGPKPLRLTRDYTLNDRGVPPSSHEHNPRLALAGDVVPARVGGAATIQNRNRLGRRSPVPRTDRCSARDQAHRPAPAHSAIRLRR